MKNKAVVSQIDIDYKGEKMTGVMITNVLSQSIILWDGELSKIIVQKRRRISAGDDFSEWSEPVEI